MLRTRRGNSFEMATLLASMLIGSGYAACVVSGYATREVTLNDQRRVQCPFIPAPDEFEVIIDFYLLLLFCLLDRHIAW